MKCIYLILILLIHGFSFAQDPRLFENEWYLTNLIVNGSDNLPPLNTINLIFEVQNSNIRAGGTNCNELFAQGIHIENNFSDFSLTNWAITLLFCPEINYYESLYFSFFTENGFTNQFTYLISESDDVRTLTINSVFNKQAIYSSQMLSNKEYKTIDFSIYPNPTSEFISVSLNNQSLENAQVKIYDNLGQLCKAANIKSSQEKIDIKNLANGIYLVQLETSNGTVTKKIIKL